MKTDNPSENTITIRTIQPADLADVICALDDSFSQYNIPLSFGGGKLEEMIYLYDIELDCSLVSVEKGEITGVMLAGRRGDVAHIGPMGIILKRQGSGLGKTLMEYAMKHLKGMGAKKVILEVIADNHRARRLYESVGFIKTRVLRCYRAKREDVEKTIFKKPDFSKAVRMKAGEREFLVAYIESSAMVGGVYIDKPVSPDIPGGESEQTAGKALGRLWNVDCIDTNLLLQYGMPSSGRPWQRDYETIVKKKENLLCYAAFEDNGEAQDGNNILAFILAGEYGIVDMGIYHDNFNSYLRDNFGVDENFEENGNYKGTKDIVLKSIYGELILKSGGENPMLAFKNVTPDEDFTDFAVRFSFENYLNQFEMEYVF